MPGTTIVCDSNGTATDHLDICLAAGLHDERYRAERITLTDASMSANNGPIAIGQTSYPSYPIKEYSIANRKIVLEGYLYDRSLAEFRETISRCFDGPPATYGDSVDSLCRWLSDIDGEFVITILDADNNQITVINDLLGRLPLYVSDRPGEPAVISRELPIVLDMIGTEAIEYDRLGVAEALTFGYSLGSRTMFESISYLPPGTFLTNTGGEFHVSRYASISTEVDYHDDASRVENACALANIFKRSIRDRATLGPTDVGYPSVISLSGGLDSRAILAAFDAEGLPYISATMNGPIISDTDVANASNIAEVFRADWEQYDLGPRRIFDIDRMIRLKSGRDPIPIAHLLQFFDGLLDEHGELTYFAGDGGDKFLPDLRPPVSLSDEDLAAVAEYILTHDTRIDPEDAARIVGIDPKAIRQDLLTCLESYGTSDGDQAYIDFLLKEKTRNWLFEAEDTNRCYFWSPAPFYSLPFVRYVLGVPNDQKVDYRLYDAFLEELSVKTTLVENTTFGARVGSRKHCLMANGYRRIQRHPRLFDRVLPMARDALGIFDPPEGKPIDREIISRQIENSDSTTAVIDPAAVQRVWQESSYPRRDVLLLMTATSLIDDLSENSDRVLNAVDRVEID